MNGMIIVYDFAEVSKIIEISTVRKFRTDEIGINVFHRNDTC